MSWQLIHGECLEQLAELEEASIDAVVTDPPYGLEFMGKAWDTLGGDRRQIGDPSFKQGDARHGSVRYGGAPYGQNAATAGCAMQDWHEAWAREALRVLKPGGQLLAFGGTRTYHRLVCAIEDAGFDIRDQLAWLFGSGFPKSRNLGEGRGTALKPGHEPIVLARKPMVGSAGANVELHGTGGLNIDACRIEGVVPQTTHGVSSRQGEVYGKFRDEPEPSTVHPGGRWPANVVLDEEAADLLDEQTGTLTSGANPTRRGSDKFRDVYGDFAAQEECVPQRGLDRGGASRFFYCAKASREERNAGLDAEFATKPLNWSNGYESPGTFQSDGTDRTARNPHPTVKPVELMRWLCRLITPPGGALLDPFTGSGTTGIAAVLEGFDFIGIEREAEYVALATARIAYWERYRPAQLDLLGGAA